MSTRHSLLAVLLSFSLVPVAQAGEAATWSPPALVPARPAEPSPPPVEAPAPELHAAADEPVYGPEPPPEDTTPRARPARKGCKKNKARCNRRRAPKVDPRLLDAGTQRARLIAVAQPMAAAGRPQDAARMLGGAAEAHADPVLYLAAAEAELAAANHDAGAFARALRLTEQAQRLIAEPTELRIAAADGPKLDAEAQELTSYVTRRQSQLRQLRRGKAERTTGVTFLALGGTGLGVLAAGAVLSARVKAARAAYTGEDSEYLAALTDGEQRAGTLLAAGLVSGLIGAAIGIPLTITGSRKLKRARAETLERPSFHFEPGLAGASFRGSF